MMGMEITTPIERELWHLSFQPYVDLYANTSRNIAVYFALQI